MVFNISQKRLKTDLQRIYSLPPPETIRVEKSSNGYLAGNCLERSIRLLATELKGKLLDVGCGDQPYKSIYLKYCSSIEACDYDSKKPGIDFACPADNIPRDTGGFDSLVSTEVLEHVPDPAKTLQEFSRVLKPEGILLLSTPCYWPPHELPYDYFRYPLHGLIHLIETNGFEISRLVPRGGQWALLGQVGSHVLNRHLANFGFQKAWNSVFEFVDRKRCSPLLSCGWTVLAKCKQKS